MELYNFLKQITLQAGENIRSQLNEPLEIETKSNANDLVTNMDKATEQFLFDRIQHVYPDHRIIGEEGSGKNIVDIEGVIWIIDPIDGTLNFVHQQENFAISIGIFIDGKKYAGVVYDVMRDILYEARAGHGAFKNGEPIGMLDNTALQTSIISMNPNWLTKDFTKAIYVPIVKDARSARSYGSAALDFAYVATNKINAYVTLRLHPWDFAGGLIIVEEVGGVVTNQLGEPLNLLTANSILVANPSLHEEILIDYLKPHQSELTRLHGGMFSKR
ncbi:inositol monophosphatase family protein [Macrococcoides caseolyticum]|uniref:inositol monophosphatase family protein n=1 Tax=Macrococcoides caseolyticum TaxID=69966 RepID=UPI001F2C4EA2|nr:inositol monophosphatase family protein [Macrococcus caseolyticus]MCE4956908.1 inositol monophosphatase family protein [Macrococcus caseolyticus]